VPEPFTGSKVQGSEVRSSMQISTVDTSILNFGCDFGLKKTNSWHSRLIHTQNGGIIRLRVAPRLIYSIRLQQKRNVEPLNPEPVNAYDVPDSPPCVVVIAGYFFD
jgi:hypothetical protein